MSQLRKRFIRDGKLPQKINDISLLGLKYKNSMLDIKISGSGNQIEHFYINGKEYAEFFLSGDAKGKIDIEIKLVGTQL